ncbi:MAG: DUF4836 family protein [Bacteroides sp.]|nr:DUF4836 family protein [Bacteroides sp.]
MKKNLFFHFSVLAMLMVLISACSSPKSEYTNVIPSDASQVIAIRLKPLADKAGTKDKENKEALQKLTDALKSDMNAATFQQLEVILKDPAQSGVDINAPLYVFSAPSFPYTTMVAKVQNENDLQKLLEIAEKEQISSPITEADGYSFAQIGKKALLAFTPGTLMVINYTGTSQLEKVKEGIPTLLKQNGEACINSTAAFKKMLKQNGDIHMLISPSSLLSAYANPLNYGLSHSIDLKELKMLGNLSFEKGKIELKIENLTENAELKALFEKQMKSTCPIENTFLKYFPKSTLALFSIGVNGEEFYNALQENEQFRNDFSITKAAEIKDLFSAFQKDLTVGLINVTMNSNPSFLAYANVKNDAPLKALYEKKAELGLRRGEDIVKLNENEYVYKSRAINVFFGIRDKQMYATNDELLYKNVCKTVSPSVKETDFASDLKGKRTAFAINAEAVLDLPVVKMLVGFGGQEYSTYYSLLGNISYLEAVGNEDKATVTLQLKNKDVNALKQIVDFVKQFAGM